MSGVFLAALVLSLCCILLIGGLYIGLLISWYIILPIACFVLVVTTVCYVGIKAGEFMQRMFGSK